jgi:hypothetical protein
MKKLRNVKIKVWQMSLESATAAKMAGSSRSLPDPAGSMAGSSRIPTRFGRIPAVLARFGRLLTMAGIRRYSGQFQPASGDGARMSPDSGDRMLPDSGAGWILTTDNY